MVALAASHDVSLSENFEIGVYTVATTATFLQAVAIYTICAFEQLMSLGTHHILCLSKKIDFKLSHKRTTYYKLQHQAAKQELSIRINH